MKFRLIPRWGAAVFIVAILIRALALLEIQNVPALMKPTNDGARYHEQAVALASGEWPFAGAFYQSPAYPFFEAGLYKLFGPDPPVVLRAQVLLGALSALFLALATAQLFGAAAGLIAGVCYALYGPGILWDLGYQKTSLAQFLQCLAVWLVVRHAMHGAGANGRGMGSISGRTGAGQAGRAWRASSVLTALGLGVALGLMSITRETLLPIALAAPVLLWWRGRAAGIAIPALMAAGLALSLLPTTIYNASRGGGFAVTTVQAGPNFYIGNHRGATGTYEELRPGRQDPRFEGADARAIAEEESGRTLTAAEVSRFWIGQSLSEMRAAPGEAAALIVRKLRLAWNQFEVPDAWGMEFYRRQSQAFRFLAPLHFGVIAPLALLGVFASFSGKRRHAVLWLTAAAAGITIFVAVFYIFGRYRAPLVPVLIPVAACGVLALVRALRSRNARLLATLGAVLGVSMMVVNVPMLEEPLEESVSFVNAALFHIDREEWEPAERYLQSALTLDPQSPSGYRELGRVLIAREKFQEGADALDRATELAPGWVNPHIDKGELLIRFGRFDEALTEYREANRLLPGNDFIRGRIAELEEKAGAGSAPSP